VNPVKKERMIREQARKFGAPKLRPKRPPDGCDYSLI
jgi:hypothetical protein